MVAENSPSEQELDALEATLLNTSGNVLLHNRFRALFTLKALKNERAIKIISKGFQFSFIPRAEELLDDRTGFCDPSALLKHELAYCLGQMGDPLALPVLTSVLKDESEDPMVRHEVYSFSSPPKRR